MKNLIYAGLIALFILATVPYNYATVKTYTVTVTDKERVTSKDGTKYLVFTDKMVFENTDSLLHLKFNSSDVQGKLKLGCSYDLTTYGLRIPFLSMYKNITKVSNNTCN